MLASLLAKDVQWIGVLDSLIYAIIGFAVTFVGIFLLIFFIWLLGKAVNQAAAVRSRKKAGKAEEAPAEVPAASASDEVSEEIRVAIVAAIAAYYVGENSSCEFKVKRIKRL